jgi:TRAP-type mannitol/chloroaromatic compound transport system permease small subunit
MLVALANNIDRANLFLGRTTAWLTLAMAIGMTITVIQRYLFASNYVWETELILYLHAFVFLASAGYTLQSDCHVRVDIIYEHLSNKAKAVVTIMGTLFLLFPVCFCISYYAHEFIISSWYILENSREYDGMPGVYILKSFIWLFSGTLILQGISTLITNSRTLLEPDK